MIRVAYVINYLGKNGPSHVVLNLINNIDKKKYDISLITLFPGNDVETIMRLRNSGVTVYECTGLNRMKCLTGHEKEFTEIIGKGKFDVLHTHGIIPDVLSSRLKFPLKKVTTLHNNMYEDYLDTYGYVKSRIFVVLHLAALKKLDECVCCSESIYQAMKFKVANVSYIRNGIEQVSSHTVVTREEVNIPERARVYLFAGALNSRKNIVDLVEDFVSCHNADEYLMVLGKGEKESKCKEKADDHVRLLGFQTDPAAFMNIADVYVSASKSEGFSISVLEALSCGLGLFLSDIPSHEEVIQMGRDTYLGETFQRSNFKTKMELIRKKCLIKKEIAAFQKEYLSASRMAAEYQKKYEN